VPPFVRAAAFLFGGQPHLILNRTSFSMLVSGPSSKFGGSLIRLTMGCHSETDADSIPILVIPSEQESSKSVTSRAVLWAQILSAAFPPPQVLLQKEFHSPGPFPLSS
jgi:hypothetical protein